MSLGFMASTPDSSARPGCSARASIALDTLRPGPGPMALASLRTVGGNAPTFDQVDVQPRQPQDRLDALDVVVEAVSEVDAGKDAPEVLDGLPRKAPPVAPARPRFRPVPASCFGLHVKPDAVLHRDVHGLREPGRRQRAHLLPQLVEMRPGVAAVDVLERVNPRVDDLRRRRARRSTARRERDSRRSSRRGTRNCRRPRPRRRPSGCRSAGTPRGVSLIDQVATGGAKMGVRALRRCRRRPRADRTGKVAVLVGFHLGGKSSSLVLLPQRISTTSLSRATLKRSATSAVGRSTSASIEPP